MTSHCFVIAEAGVNHNGSAEMAHRLVDVAADAGADAIKFQTFSADRLLLPNTPKVAYQAERGGGADQYEMIRALELSPDTFRDLKRHCGERGIEFMSTAFDIPGLAFLVEELGMERVKVASGEATNVPFLRAAARTRLPVLLSTGMCTLEEVGFAVTTIRDAWRAAGIAPEPALCILQCTSAYPTPPDDAHLASMRTMADAFGFPVGFSDHTEGVTVAMGAVALGATAIEKHFTLDRTLPGPDHRASLEPGELATMVAGIRAVERAIGSPIKERRAIERDTAPLVRRSLVAVRDIAAGETIVEDMLIPLRPERGIPARDIDRVVGRPAWRAFAAGEPLSWD